MDLRAAVLAALIAAMMGYLNLRPRWDLGSVLSSHMTYFDGEVQKSYGWPLTCCEAERRFGIETMGNPLSSDADLLQRLRKEDASGKGAHAVAPRESLPENGDELEIFHGPWSYAWHVEYAVLNALAIAVVPVMVGFALLGVLPGSRRSVAERGE